MKKILFYFYLLIVMVICMTIGLNTVNADPIPDGYYHGVSVDAIKDTLEAAYEHDSYSETGAVSGWLDDSYITKSFLEVKLYPDVPESDLEVGDILLPLYMFYSTADKLISKSGKIDFFSWIKDRDIQKAWMRILERKDSMQGMFEIKKTLEELYYKEYSKEIFDKIISRLDFIRSGYPSVGDFSLFIAGEMTNGTSVGDLLTLLGAIKGPSVISIAQAAYTTVNLTIEAIDDSLGYPDLRQAYLLYHIGHQTVEEWGNRPEIPLVDMMMKAASGNSNNNINNCYFWDANPYHIGYPYKGGYDHIDGDSSSKKAVPLEPYDDATFYNEWAKILFYKNESAFVSTENKNQAKAVLPLLADIFHNFKAVEGTGWSLEKALTKINVITYPFGGTNGDCSSLGYIFSLDGPAIKEPSLDYWDMYMRHFRTYYANAISTALRGFDGGSNFYSNKYFLGRGIGFNYQEDTDNKIFLNLMQFNMKAVHEEIGKPLPLDSNETKGLALSVPGGWKQRFNNDIAICVSPEGHVAALKGDFLRLYELGLKTRKDMGIPLKNEEIGSDGILRQYFQHGYMTCSNGNIDTYKLRAVISGLSEDGTEVVGSYIIKDAKASMRDETAFPSVTYKWIDNGTEIATGSQPTIRLQPGEHEIRLELKTPEGMFWRSESFRLTVLQNPVLAPTNVEIESDKSDPVLPDTEVMLTAKAYDPSEEGLIFEWWNDQEQMVGQGSTFNYSQPFRKYTLTLFAINPHGKSKASITLGITPDDIDNDGLSDEWEKQYFGNLEQEPAGDPDDDGDTNEQEFLKNTDPIKPGYKGIFNQVVYKPYNVTKSNGSYYWINIFIPSQDIYANVRLEGGTLDLKGKTITIYGNFIQSGGTLDINGGNLTINGNLIQSGGTLKINGGRLLVKGDYQIQGSNEKTDFYSTGLLNMTNEMDYVLVEGDFLMHSNRNHSSLLKAGILEVKGDFAQKAKRTFYWGDPESNFYTSGTHKVVLSGSQKQTITIDTSNKNYSHFNILELKNTSDDGVVFSTDVYVSQLFNHQQNTFALIQPSDSTFPDYDKDTYKDNEDFFPLDPSRWAKGDFIAGDLNSNGEVDLGDAIIALKLCTGINVFVHKECDATGDGKIGLEEAIYILQYLAGLHSNAGCSITDLLPLNGWFDSNSGTGIIPVTTSSTECSWIATTSADWITINSGSGTGSGSVAFSVSENTTGFQRSGIITIADQSITIMQDRKDITDGLVGKWDFDFNIIPDTALDSSGNNRNGTIVGAFYDSGKEGMGLNFSGDGNYLQLPGTFSDYVTDHFTIALWANVLESRTVNYLFHARDDRPGIMLDSINKIRWYFKPDYASSPLSSQSPTGASSGVLEIPTSWSHIACTWNGSEFAAYLNGQKIGGKSLPEFELGERLFIGSDGNADRSFEGIIDTVLIYNRALSADEIAYLAS